MGYLVLLGITFVAVMLFVPPSLMAYAAYKERKEKKAEGVVDDA